MALPLVTVTICAYNGERYLRETLDSVLLQSYSNFEVVIVDDGSNDSTLDIIKQFAALDHRIRWFSRKNAGLSASRNFAFSQAKGEWIAIIDQDDLCYPERLKRQIETALQNPTAELIFCNTNYINENGEITGNHLSNFKIPELFIPKGKGANLLLRQGCYIDSEALFIKKSTISRLGPLKENLRYACDYEYFIRIGFEINFAYTKETLAAWRIHSKQLSCTDLNRFKEIREVLLEYLSHKGLSIHTQLIILYKLARMMVAEVYHKTLHRLDCSKV